MVERHQATRGVVCRERTVWYAIAGLAWLALIVCGLLWLSHFELTAGRPSAAPARWPAQVHLARGPYTLIMSAHPRCPCTRASIDELAFVMHAARGRLTAHVLFFTPAQADPDWWQTDLWAKAAAIPGVTPVVDRGGTLQRAFGAMTSGTVVMYDERDRLRFSGGVTEARGHAGENAGRLSLIALMETGQDTRAETPVFGCALRVPDTATATAGDGSFRR